MKVLDDLTLDLHDAYLGHNIKAITLTYDGEQVLVIAKDTKLAVSLMQLALEELTLPKDSTIQ